MVPPDGDFVIVDWDEALLAPRERDLMFVDGVAGGHVADPPAFFEGCGDVAIDAVVLTYYRAEWTIQDLALYAAASLAPDASDEAKAESFEIISAILRSEASSTSSLERSTICIPDGRNHLGGEDREDWPRQAHRVCPCHHSWRRSYSAATRLGTTIRQASSTSSRISASSMAASRTTTQW